MPTQCPSCHAQVDSGKFCPACGTAIPGAAGTGTAAVSATTPSGDVSLVGQTLGGKYKIVALLGEGGMGCVYKGEQLLGTKTRNVAIKTLHAHLSKDAKVLARFEREVGTIAELEHPNTIQVYDFGKTEGEGILYIVMEFVLGKNLADTLEKGGAMEPARVEKIMNQVCGSLEEAHGRGIVHRDLKPDNIVLTERAGSKDFVKVLDFGIAKRSNEEDKNEQKLTQQGMVLGTPPYMSPEQFTGKPIDARSDIYSLAIMAYEMLTANLPFAANTAWEWATQHMTVPPKDIDSMPFHERIPPKMKDALRKALQKSPDDRFPTVRQFFDAFSGGAAAYATPIDPPGQLAMGPGPAMAQAKGRTEVGTPLDFRGAAASGGAYGAQPGVAMQAGTPAQGNVAFPTPNAGVPQAPPNARQSGSGEGGGNRGMLLGIAAVIGVLSVGAIGFALHGRASGGGAPIDLGSVDSGPGAAPVNLLNGLDAGAPPAVTPAPSDSNLGALQPSSPSGGGHPVTHHDAGPGKEPPGKEPPGKEPPGPQPKPAPSGRPGAEPFACMQASLMRKAGNVAAYQQLKRVCEATGGSVPPEAGMSAEEILVDFTDSRERPATQVRSTLVTTSVQAIRAHGRFDDYSALLPAELRSTILTVVAGVWLPMSVAEAHYSACNELGLSLQEQFAIGKEVGDRVQGTMLGLVVRTAKQAGLTPWTGFSQSTKLYERLFLGGSVRIVKLGPKEARIEMVNNRLFGFQYFRSAFRGLVCAGAMLFCEKAYAHELPRLTSGTAMGVRVSWA